MGLLWSVMPRCGNLMPQKDYRPVLRKQINSLPGSRHSYGFFGTFRVVRGAKCFAEQYRRIKTAGEHCISRKERRTFEANHKTVSGVAICQCTGRGQEHVTGSRRLICRMQHSGPRWFHTHCSGQENTHQKIYRGTASETSETEGISRSCSAPDRREFIRQDRTGC